MIDWAAFDQWWLALAALILLADRFMTRRGTEWRDVAASRGERIDDLEAEVASLKQELAKVVARLDVMTTDFAEMIAARIVCPSAGGGR